MALIKCGECGNEVSSNAISCPKCGNPIAAVVAPVVAVKTAKPITVTTQATGKKFKGHQLGAAALCCLGVVLIVAGDSSAAWGALVMLAGLVWYFAARAGAWWNHS